MTPTLKDPAFALALEYQRLRAQLTDAKRVAASLEAAKKQAETKKLSNTERRALLKQMIAKEQEP